MTPEDEFLELSLSELQEVVRRELLEDPLLEAVTLATPQEITGLEPKPGQPGGDESWFIALRKVSQSIAKHQREFLDRGLPYLRPLSLQDVSEDTGMPVSTISRVLAKN